MLTKRIGRSTSDGAPSVAPRQLEEQAAFLGAGDEQVVARLRGALEGAGFAPAEQRMDGVGAVRVSPQGPGQRRAVDRHRLVAVADQGRHRRGVQGRQAGKRATPTVATVAGPAPSGEATAGSGALPRAASISSSKSPRTAAWFIAAQHRERDRVGLAVVVDVGVEAVHHVEVGIAEELLHGRVADAGVDVARDVAARSRSRFVSRATSSSVGSGGGGRAPPPASRSARDAPRAASARAARRVPSGRGRRGSRFGTSARRFAHSALRRAQRERNLSLGHHLRSDGVTNDCGRRRAFFSSGR